MAERAILTSTESTSVVNHWILEVFIFCHISSGHIHAEGCALVPKAIQPEISYAWVGRKASSSLTSCQAVILVSNILSMDSVLLLHLDRNITLST